MSTKQTKSKEETAVAVKQESSMQLASLQSEFSSALNVRTDLLKIPYLRLTHGTSEDFKAGVSGLGDFSCGLRAKNYGKEVTIIPLFVSESASLLFSPKNPPTIISDEERKISVNGDVLCSSQDLIHNKDGILCKNCPYGEYHADWGTKSEKRTPKCKQSIDVICLVDGEIKSVMINFRKSNYSAGRSLVNLISNDPRMIPFGSKYTLKSKVTISKDKEEYMMISEAITRTILTDEEVSNIIPIARQILNAKKAGKIEVVNDSEVDLPV